MKIFLWVIAYFISACCIGFLTGWIFEHYGILIGLFVFFWLSVIFSYILARWQNKLIDV